MTIRTVSVPSSPQAPVRLRRATVVALALALAVVAGCGRSGTDAELPDAARKSLIQRKVDVRPRASTARPGQR